MHGPMIQIAVQHGIAGNKHVVAFHPHRPRDRRALQPCQHAARRIHPSLRPKPDRLRHRGKEPDLHTLARQRIIEAFDLLPAGHIGIHARTDRGHVVTPAAVIGHAKHRADHHIPERIQPALMQPIPPPAQPCVGNAIIQGEGQFPKRQCPIPHDRGIESISRLPAHRTRPQHPAQGRPAPYHVVGLRRRA